MVPVLHIVGYPSTVQQKMRPLLHHTLGDGRYFPTFLTIVSVIKLILPYFRYDAYQQAATQFVIYEANLSKKETAAAEIDMAITQCITKVSGNILFCYNLVTCSGTACIYHSPYGSC